MNSIFKRDKVILAIIVLGMCSLGVIDVIEDLASGETIFQVAFEGIIFAFAIFGIAVLLNRNFLLKNQISNTKTELLNSNIEAKKWYSQHQEILKGFGQAIDNQLTVWDLSATEKEIALLLLKGLSFKEIAGIRGTNEKTVRQQSLKIYEKSGLTGRTELSAFFLEDILSPINTDANLKA